jgi:hypothetical protein
MDGICLVYVWIFCGCLVIDSTEVIAKFQKAHKLTFN